MFHSIRYCLLFERPFPSQNCGATVRNGVAYPNPLFLMDGSIEACSEIPAGGRDADDSRILIKCSPIMLAQFIDVQPLFFLFFITLCVCV